MKFRPQCLSKHMLLRKKAGLGIKKVSSVRSTFTNTCCATCSTNQSKPARGEDQNQQPAS